MSRIAYVNGRYMRHGTAQVHIEDRATQFSDGVYEVIAVVDGRLVDAAWHYERLANSLNALDMAAPMGQRALDSVLCEVVRRNHVEEGIVYLQISRGVAPRNHVFPADAKPTVTVTARRGRPASARVLVDGVKVVTVPDQRWRRRDIKSVSLLPNILAKQKAAQAGAFEAWQVDDHGYVTEGSQSNAWIVNNDGVIVTRDANADILNGITRRRIITLARSAGLRIKEAAFTVDEGLAAREAFLTGTSSFVVPVVQIDDRVIANGVPGTTTGRLRSLYLDFVRGGGAAN